MPLGTFHICFGGHMYTHFCWMYTCEWDCWATSCIHFLVPADTDCHTLSNKAERICTQGPVALGTLCLFLVSHSSAIGFSLGGGSDIYLATAGLVCDMWDLVPWSGIELGPPELGATGPPRKSLNSFFFF